MRKEKQYTGVTTPLPREGLGGGAAYCIGHLGKPHGVRGEINFSFTSDVWDRVEADYLFIMTDGILVPFFLEEYRFRSDDTALLKFDGLDTIEAVAEYVGCEVYFPYSLTPEGDAEDYTWQYFVGFRVEDAEAGLQGEIVGVDESTANVLFEVRPVAEPSVATTPDATEDGEPRMASPLLIPAVEAFIRDIDHAARVVHMALPDGLLELD